MGNIKEMFRVLVIVCALFLVPNNVDAADISSANSLRETFNGKNATINGTSITLTGNVELLNPEWTENLAETKYDVINFSGENYTLNLNGFTLKTQEIYVVDGVLTINDTTGEGKIDTEVDYINTEEEGKIIINNGTFEYVGNLGELVINNGTIDHIQNYGTLVIENGTFGSLGQMGDAEIKGGTFTSYASEEDWGTFEHFTSIDLDMGTTIISGGEFKKSNLDFAFVVQSRNPVDSTSINQTVPSGYLPIYGSYMLKSNDCWKDEETQETICNYVGEFGSLKIIEDETEEILNSLAPNGIWNIKSAKPKDMANSEFLLSAVANKSNLPEGYSFMAWVEPSEEFNPEFAALHLYYEGRLLESKSVKVVYNEPSDLIVEEVNSVISKINDYTQGKHSIETGFRVEDLYLINYLTASQKGIDASSALNFSKYLIELTNGSNISYKYDDRLGSMPTTGLWQYSGGQVVVFFDGMAIDTTIAGLTTNHVLYIPMDTEDTDEAKINAALKRIKEYLGTTDGITIEVGGTLESLNIVPMNITWNQYGFIDEQNAGNNYYNITINGKTYRFVICKKENLETPTYLGSDILSNIYITSDSSELSLDTALKVKEVATKDMEKVLGTTDYVAYDISLYSNTKGVNVTKLENGKFIVSIPVPEKLKNKTLTVYYINSKGEKEEHLITVKDGMASFETDHFSTYALVDSSVINNPATGDNIMIIFIIGGISLVALTGTLLYFIKQKRNA